MTCWATVYAMMRSWREGKQFAIAEALEKPGKQYVDLFKQDWGLLPSQFRDFWTRGGLTVRGYASFPDYIWYDLLIKHGLLAVGEGNSLPPVTGLHLRVLEGMSVRRAPTTATSSWTRRGAASSIRSRRSRSRPSTTSP
jgi:hypothetical protein